ncbi:MAG TPA: VOC family protein [Rhodanobacteraceae bacterium]|nr:VOC family protein [Rhodanobacteraceae bacterium]
MPVRGIGHVNLRASAATIERLRRFYIDIVGLHEGPRPAFRSGSRGHWLYAQDRDVLHLTIARDDGATTQSPGVFNHLAFDCDGLESTCARLDAAGIEYATDVVDALHQTQLFLTDPAGIGVELTFTESQPESR